MKNIIIYLFIFLIISACQDSKTLRIQSDGEIEEVKLTGRVIYGVDNRLDVYAAPNYWQQKADATVVLVRKSNLEDLGNGTTKVKGTVFGSAFNLCASEPFRDQTSAGFCSGSLVGSDVIMTAGHCIKSKTDCGNTKFVFGFALKQPGQQPDSVNSAEVYSCSQVIKSEQASNGSDFALVRLDRTVIGHTPLPIRKQDVISEGEGLVVIGHPSGIPTKVSGGASVRTLKSTYLVTNLDTYGGNSGSAVFNENTGLVEGILVRGETDFVYQNGCRLSNVCTETGCRGEDVTRIDRIWPYLKKLKPKKPTRSS